MNLARSTYGRFRTLKFRPENRSSLLFHRRFASDDVSSRLASFIKPGKFSEANTLRQHLQEQGIQIPPKNIYRQAAALALQRPDYLEHANTFEAWLSLCPEAEHRDILAFPNVCTILLAEPVKNMHLLVIFGVQCARKGYIRLVKERIMPIVAELGNADQRRELQVELDMASVTGQEIYDLNGLVETALAEPAHQPCPEPASSYTVIEHSLPALLPEPRENDPSIFEDDSFYEYPASYAPTPSRRTPLTQLYSLIEAGMYQDAKRVLLEIQDLGISVPPSFIYEKAAQFALGLPTGKPSEDPQLNYEDRLADFKLWFSLIPPFDAGAAHDFSQTRKLIFGTVVTQLDILIQFGLIISSKGYSELFAAPVLLTVTQYTNSDVSMRFIRRFMENNAKFYNSMGQQDEYTAKKTAYYIRGLAIRGLTTAGHIDDALSLLKEDPQSCSAYTLTYVIERLVRAGPKYDEERWWVQDIRDGRNPTPAPVNRALLSNILSSVDPPDPELSPRAITDDLPFRLRRIKRGLRDELHPPRAVYIMSFIQEYIDLGRTRALDLLRRLAFRTGYSAASRYIFSTILYHYHQGNHGRVIQEFCSAFYLTGVPRDEMVLALENAKRDARYQSSSSQSPPFPQHRAQTQQWDITLGKLFPSPYHCSIAWHSLVALTPTAGRLEILYQKLLRFAKGHVEDQLPSLLPDYAHVAPLVPPPSWINRVDVSAFTPFMRPLMHHSSASSGAGGGGGGASRGPKIIREMLEIGLKPTVYHFTELAGYYAYSGEGRQAFFVLERMEAQLDKQLEIARKGKEEEGQEEEEEEGSSTSSEEATETSPDSDPSQSPSISQSSTSSSPILIPPANVVLYTSLMRNFLSSRNLEAVEEVNRRFRMRFPHYGSDDGEGRGVRDGYLERVYSDWRYVLQKREVAAGQAGQAKW